MVLNEFDSLLSPKLSYREVAQQRRAIGESSGDIGSSPIFSTISSFYVINLSDGL